jgi:hypothetical protein
VLWCDALSCHDVIAGKPATIATCRELDSLLPWGTGIIIDIGAVRDLQVVAKHPCENDTRNHQVN